jgi:hypothetical protein
MCGCIAASHQVLHKTFYMENPDEVVPDKFVGCTIDWAAGKDTTGAALRGARSQCVSGNSNGSVPATTHVAAASRFCLCACARVCVCACVRARARVCVCVHVCVFALHHVCTHRAMHMRVLRAQWRR